ncbi:uncharacterized protein [Typha angustifolia]|uniref:uncharacterized protein isoform X2 n=1 Tax=Typha angustifolia TaxID=59011 RepID=UPI003C2AE09C
MATPHTPAAAISGPVVPRRLLGFLREHFKTPDDLDNAPSLVAKLNRECEDLEIGLRDLEERLSVASSSWLSRSDEAQRILRRLQSRGGELETEQERMGRMLDVELPLLAKEVTRIETVRLYAVVCLQL